MIHIPRNRRRKAFLLEHTCFLSLLLRQIVCVFSIENDAFLTAITAYSLKPNSSNNGNLRKQQKQQSVSSIEDCISWIDTYCHRPFLHAVVASQYHFLYRGMTSLIAIPQPTTSTADQDIATTIQKPRPMIQYEPSDLLQIQTYGTIDSVRFFQQLEKEIIHKYGNDRNHRQCCSDSTLFVRPSIGHLGTTSIVDASQWGTYAASIWPCTPPIEPCCPKPPLSSSSSSSICYAWFRDYGLFYPRRRRYLNHYQEIVNDVIFDGDNGSINSITSTLSDALQQSNCEIMFLSDTPYLSIPSIYDDEIRHRLQHAYLI